MNNQGLYIPITGDASGFVGALNIAASALARWKAQAASAYDVVDKQAAKLNARIAKGIFDDKTTRLLDKYTVGWSKLQLAEDAYYADVAAKSRTFRASLQDEIATLKMRQQVVADSQKVGKQQYLNDLATKAQDMRAKHQAAMDAQVAATQRGLDAQKVAQQQYYNDIAAQAQAMRAKHQAAVQAAQDAETAAMQRAIAARQALQARFAAFAAANQVTTGSLFQRGFAQAQANAQAGQTATPYASAGAAINRYIKDQEAAAAAAVKAAQGTNQASSSLKTFGSLVKDMLSGNGLPGLIAKFTALGGAGIGLYKVFQVGRGILRDALHDYRKLGEGILGLKHVTGDTTQETSELLFVSATRGVSSLSLQMRIAQMAKHVVDDHKWVRALGVEYKNLDGTVKSTQQIFYEFADALQAVSDTEKREAGAMAVFGRGYKDILPVLALTKKERKELTEIGKKSGAIFDDEDLKAYTQFEMSMRVLKASMTALGATVARLVTPYILGFINTMQDLIATVVKFVRSAPEGSKAFKALGLAVLMFTNPILGSIILLSQFVQGVSWGGKALVIFAQVLGEISGKTVSVAVKTIQYLMDAILLFAEGVLKVGEVITGNRFWKFLFGDGAHEAIEGSMGVISEIRHRMDKNMSGLAQDMWDNGGKMAKKLGEGFVEILKKMKIKKEDVNIGFGPGMGFDPDPNAGGGGGGKRKTKLQEYFENLVKQSREVVETLRDNAIQAKKDMKDLADRTAEDFRKAMSLDTIAESLGGTASPTRLIAMFQKRLGQMKNFVANIKTLRALGLPAEMLADLANMGMIDGARLAQSLVSNPSAIPQLRDIQAQINAATQEAGVTVSEAVMGQRVMDAIAAAVGAQNRFGDLLGKSGKFGYGASQADIEAATQNITQQVMMSVQSNADPAVIEQAIAWALKTGVPMYSGGGGGGGGRVRTGSGGSSMMPNLFNTHMVTANGSLYGNQNVQMPSGQSGGGSFSNWWDQFVSMFGNAGLVNPAPHTIAPVPSGGNTYDPNNPTGYTQDR